MQFQFGDLVWVHLKKERLPKGKHTKFMMKKISPRKLVHKFSSNTYEIALPPDIGISPIFNVLNLVPYMGDVVACTQTSIQEEGDVEWLKELPLTQPLKLECIFDTKIMNKTRKNTYKKYLVKWNRPL